MHPALPFGRSAIALAAALAFGAAHAAPTAAPAAAPTGAPDAAQQRAAKLVSQMTLDEKIGMVFGYFGTEFKGQKAPEGALPRKATCESSGTYDCTFSRCAFATSGPISVASSSGEPTFTPATAGSSISMKRSKTLRSTRMRLRAQQSWPAFSNTA